MCGPTARIFRSALRMSRVDFPALFCFGDSLTQRSFNTEDGCWGAMLASRYQRKVDVLNRGFSAYNSEQATCLLPRLLPKGAPAPYVMLIWFGANDCCVPQAPQHVPLDDYESNLKSIMNHAATVGIPRERVVLLTPPKYDHKAWVAHKAKDGVLESQVGRGEDLCEDYARRCAEVASRNGTLLVDVCAAMKARDDWRSLMLDGLHFNVDGAKFIASLLASVLDPIIESLPCIFPDKEQIDFSNVRSQIQQWIP
ncbi:isoamyl acetate-hydrolyzing esterase 1 homolog [Galendromus occidentalis]|uniref:Isoamyl acetate-hydrolyzing esterase 1 homolog n=1 Tax=Galendromus occidentalis TaxID=34638 RepID=A0AAJ6VXN7_9ACAR|nr:isoamyl acetate-hydrolyzing esterase 1 homolog [Galendromus occidentalis]